MINVLKKDASFFQKVAEVTLDPIIIMDSKGQVVFWNKAAEKFFGYTFSEVEGKILHSLILPKGKYDIAKSKNLNNFYKTGDSSILDKILELEVVNKKNESILIELSTSALKDGEDFYAVGTIRDISARKKIEEERKTIFNAVPAWIFYKDTENRFVSVNKVFADAMGTTEEKLEGKSLFDLYPKEIADKFWSDDREVIKSGKPKNDIVESLKIKENIVWLKTDKIPYFDKNNKVIGVIGFSVDITKQKEILDELIKKNAEVNRINELMIGRENKMIELKEEISILKNKLDLK